MSDSAAAVHAALQTLASLEAHVAENNSRTQERSTVIGHYRDIHELLQLHQGGNGQFFLHDGIRVGTVQRWYTNYVAPHLNKKWDISDTLWNSFKFLASSVKPSEALRQQQQKARELLQEERLALKLLSQVVKPLNLAYPIQLPSPGSSGGGINAGDILIIGGLVLLNMFLGRR